MIDDTLDARLLDAHRRGDGAAMANIYVEAANGAEADGDADRAAFLLTQAWIFALEAGLSLARDIHARLVSMGREEET